MKRIVVKVGSAVLTQDNLIAKERMLSLVALIAKLKKKYDVILVSSGAVAAGYGALRLDKSKHISKKAIAAAGQPILMSSYKSKFEIYGIDTAQILLTEDDFDSRKRTKMIQDIMEKLLDNGIMPIVNENDITATSDQLFGDNDQLSANIAYMTDAHLLVILSDIDGYFDKNPKEYEDAQIRKIVQELSEEELEAKSTANSEFATGGIVTKLKAANFLMQRGKKMLLANGFNLKATEEFLLENNHTLGTLFVPKKEQK